MSDELLRVSGKRLMQFGQLLLLEPPDASLNLIYQQMLDGTYGKPFIVDDGLVRYLHLGLAYVQSSMRIDRPDALDLRYTQKMMAFLLFNPVPKRIVMLGLGGGSLAKFCYRALPGADITAVEIDPDVIALRRHFAIPDDDRRFRVIAADAAQFVAETHGLIDILLIDACDAVGIAHSLQEPDFLQQAFAALGPSGILVMNLVGRKSRYEFVLKAIQRTFAHQTLLLPVRGDGHYVLFAFKHPKFTPDWRQMKAHACALKAQHGLDFPRFLQKLARASRIGMLDLVSLKLTGLGH